MAGLREARNSLLFTVNENIIDDEVLYYYTMLINIMMTILIGVMTLLIWIT